MKNKIFIWFINICILAISIISLFYLPEEIAVQWNEQGTSNTMSKYIILIFPIISVLFFVLYASSAKTFRYLIPCITAILLFASELLILCNALNVIQIDSIGSKNVNSNLFTLFGVISGIVILILGNRIPKIIMNLYCGITTPWACADPKIWVKTQRFAGKVWFFLGIALILISFMPPFVCNVGRVICFILLLFLPRIYSRVQFERQA